MRPASPSLPERDFTFDALAQGLRVDGRGLLDGREIEVTFGEELGSVECSMGQTRVLAQVEATMVRPPPERPLEGIITIHSEISPMASSDFEVGRTSDDEVLMTRMLEKVVRRSDSVDRESLCVVAGQRVWHLRLTIHFLADDGNMLDCACFAAVVALKHFRRPEVEVVGDEVIIHAPEERAPVPLSMHHTPYVLTFATFLLPSASSAINQNAPMLPTVTVVDPTRLESTLSTGTLSLALTAQREICVMQKAGGAPLDAEEILRMVDVGVKKVKEIDATVEKRIKDDWTARFVEVR